MTQRFHNSEEAAQQRRPTGEERKLWPARWLGGPEICAKFNLPALPSEKALRDFCKTGNLTDPGLASGTLHVDRVWKCEFCGCWHAETTAADPTGSSSGTTRHAKDLDAARCENVTGWRRRKG